MASRKHVHKYHKVNNSWACALSDCTHFMPKNVEHQVPGKATICWECGEKTVMDSDNMELDEPKCPSCRGIPDIDDFLEKKFGALGKLIS